MGALDALFENPPSTDEGLFDPFALLNKEKVKKVTRPKLRAGEVKTDASDFGPVTMYLVLSSFVDERTAMSAIDGWGGDSYVGYTKDNRSCLRIAVTGDTDADTARLATVFNTWKTAFTGNSVTVTATADRVEVDACEPDVVPKARPESDNSLVLPAFRFALVNEVLGDLPRAAAECFSKEFPAASAKVTLDQLTPETEEEAAPLQALGYDLARRCASLIPR